MIIDIPKFKKGVNFRELSPKEGKDQYRFVTTHNLIVKWEGEVPIGTKISFYDKNGREWLYMDHSCFIIKKGYSWDGCTPKRYIPILGWVGTPDFKKTLIASLIHDVLCQFQDTEHFPLSRLKIDDIFKDILKREKFIFSSLYYEGVRFGSLIHKKKYNTYSKIIIE